MTVRLPPSPFLYPILDTEFTTDITGDAQKLIQAGVKILQLRSKNHTKRQIYDLAVRLTDLCLEQDVLFIVNDYVDVALVTPEAGVHLGQDDFPVREARALMDRRLIGFSTHSEEQYLVAQQLPADYIAIGPVFKTTTKPTSDPSLGISNVSSWLRNKARPVVAIGGIRLDHFPELLQAGVDGIAMISELYRAGNIYETARQCVGELRKYEKI